MNLKSTFSLAVLLTTASLSAVARPDSFTALSFEGNNDEGGGGFFDQEPEFGDNGGIDGLFDPGKWLEDRITGDDHGSWFQDPIPTVDDYGSVVCNQKGPCYGLKLTCPAKCYTYINRSGKGFSASAGGGGCTMDCEKTCTASCLGG
ncbi:hypothetical protein GQ457_03G037090 [Hibiscus cannabinus]